MDNDIVRVLGFQVEPVREMGTVSDFDDFLEGEMSASKRQTHIVYFWILAKCAKGK